ncbi:MAG: fatty acyl-AMP ligase [Deltaproteobacteria bacterium]|nr:MAG: fatty acyl-AMP ligase [Deltaproteobacteria bacterium]
MNILNPTPTESHVLLRNADFPNLAAALDYAAKGLSGFNFYDGRGKLHATLSYSKLRQEAQILAKRLHSLQLERGARVAIVAETHPDFPRFFFACQYAGLTPVPLPASIHLGGHKAYVEQLRGLLEKSQASIAIAPVEFLPYLQEATKNLELKLVGTPQVFDDLEEQLVELYPLQADETAYLQYTSGSTRFPRGVMVSEAAVMHNLAGITRDGLKVRQGDRCVSWLPYYHDMGLVGFVLAPLAAQLSVDYLATRDFAMRPRLWLGLMSANHGTISFGPPFGYELSSRRVRLDSAKPFDLSAWRVAGVGAETIQVEILDAFAEKLAPFGFDRKACVGSYGMAECSLAVTFAPIDLGVEIDEIDAEHLSAQQEALPVSSGTVENSSVCRTKKLVNCGIPLPGHEIIIRDDSGQILLDRKCGTIHVRGPSVMSGYFAAPAATAKVLSADGWLNTGDIGYLCNGSLMITGREKDMIIINGRNFWPQDLEFYAEQQPEIRPGDASAISVTDDDGLEAAVMVVQYRETDENKCKELSDRLTRIIREEVGINCIIELVPAHTLPRTSSGKLSRAGTQRDYLNRQKEQEINGAASQPLAAAV